MNILWKLFERDRFFAILLVITVSANLSPCYATSSSKKALNLKETKEDLRKLEGNLKDDIQLLEKMRKRLGDTDLGLHKCRSRSGLTARLVREISSIDVHATFDPLESVYVQALKVVIPDPPKSLNEQYKDAIFSQLEKNESVYRWAGDRDDPELVERPTGKLEVSRETVIPQSFKPIIPLAVVPAPSPSSAQPAISPKLAVPVTGRPADDAPKPPVAGEPKVGHQIFTAESLLRTFLDPKYQSTGALLYRKSIGVPAANHCTGVLVHRDYFLTAAHCVEEDMAAESYSVYLPFGGIRHATTILIRPTKYDLSSNPVNAVAADIAVIRLERPINGIRLPFRRTVHNTPSRDAGSGLEGFPAYIMGFGVTGADKDDHGILRAGPVCLEKCLDSVDERFGYDDDNLKQSGFVCWARTPIGAKLETLSNTCSGDSGGPTFIELTKDGRPTGDVLLAAVTSGGIREDCEQGDHSFNTSVAAHEDWLKGIIGTKAPGPGKLVADSAYPVYGRFDEKTKQFDYLFNATEYGADKTLRFGFNSMSSNGADFRYHVLAGYRRDLKGRHVLWSSRPGETFASVEFDLKFLKDNNCNRVRRPSVTTASIQPPAALLNTSTSMTSSGDCFVTVVVERVGGKGDFQFLASWWNG